MKKYYIIAAPHITTGLMSIVFCNLNLTLFAEKNGYIPIVDMQHYSNQYFKENRVYKDNTWEYYYEQPYGCLLSDIENKSEVIISNHEQDLANISPPVDKDLPVELTDYKLDERLRQYKSYFNKYIRFNNETKKYLDDKYNQIIGKEQNVLGVFARGTDYIVRRTENHWVQPNAKQLIKKVKKILNNYPEITKIYIATEDLDIFKAFKSEFKDMLIDNNQYRISYKNKENKFKYLSQIPSKRKDHNYNMGLEYLTSLYILSKCKYFIGGRTAGSMAVYYMSEGYKYYYSFNLGIYGKGKDSLFSVVTENSYKYTSRIYTILGIKFKFKLGKNYFSLKK